MPNMPGHEEVFHDFEFVEDFLLPAAHQSWRDTFGAGLEEDMIPRVASGLRPAAGA